MPSGMRKAMAYPSRYGSTRRRKKPPPLICLLYTSAGQILEPAVTPGKSQYRPGEQGNVSIQVKGPDGTPVRNGVVALSIYDKALELSLIHILSIELRGPYMARARQ